MSDDLDLRNLRWRLVLGRQADRLHSLGGADGRRDVLLEFLYGREGEGMGDADFSGTLPGVGPSPGAGRGGGHNGASSDGSGLMTPTDWINEVYELFPRSVAEKLGDDALNRYGLVEILTSEDSLDRVTPSIGLVRAILTTKHLMDPAVLAKARRIVDRVVQQLLEQLARPVRNPFTGPKQRHHRSRFKVASNFDAKATLRANLKNYDRGSGQVIISEPLFSSRLRRQQDRWQVIICIDQSGSMSDSVIHAAVTASIFHGLGSLRVHLLAFDTEVADLTDEVADPVEVLMGVQLGGGTDIGRAVRYAAQLIDAPRQSIVIVISDFYEGGSLDGLVATVSSLVESGVKVLCLGALTTAGTATYSPELTARLVAKGAHFAVMTPDRLAAWVAEVIG